MRFLLSILLLSSATSLFGVENAIGLYPLGYYSDVPGYVQPPGTLAIRQDAYHLCGHLKGTHVHASYSLTACYYTTHLRFFCADYAVGILIPVGRIRVSTPIPYYKPKLKTFKNAAGLSEPEIVLKPKTHRKHHVAHGVGDIFVSPFRLGWHCDTLHAQFLQSVILPTGEYSKKHVSNMGLHRWATNSNIGITWLPHTRTEFSVWSGITVNYTNHKTHYRSGSEWHTDININQYITPSIKVGCSAYVYHQLTPDSGRGAAYGDFRGRLVGVGPEVAWDFELWGVPMELRSHYYKDVYGKNHLKGYSFYLTLYISFYQKDDSSKLSYNKAIGKFY